MQKWQARDFIVAEPEIYNSICLKLEIYIHSILVRKQKFQSETFFGLKTRAKQNKIFVWKI